MGDPRVTITAHRRTFTDALAALHLVADDDHEDAERRVDSRLAARELFEALRQAVVHGG